MRLTKPQDRLLESIKNTFQDTGKGMAIHWKQRNTARKLQEKGLIDLNFSGGAIPRNRLTNP